MKIYTRTGDDGTTGLIGGSRTPKSDPRLDCCGTLDELNAALGWTAVAAQRDCDVPPTLHQIQNELFTIGSHLATPDPAAASAARLPPLDETMISRLEMQIDAAESTLPPLRQFILPGGTELAARLHLARTVCRRAERLIVAFSHDRPVSTIILTYLNRLSDWLFVHARRANQEGGVLDIPSEKT